MTTVAVKITRKRQVTIPKEGRKKLKADTIMVDVASSLHEYSRHIKVGTSLKHMKDQAWEMAIHEKTSRKP